MGSAVVLGIALLVAACSSPGSTGGVVDSAQHGSGDGGSGDHGCTPMCVGVCGDDGCGGSCGDCGTMKMCQNGACVGDGNAPLCQASDCGPDGKGGSCGDCSSGATCDTSIDLCVPNGGDQAVTVAWQGACWWVCPANPPPDYDCTAGQRFQAMQFHLSDTFPVEATLYYDTDCDPVSGTDNLNDTGASTPTNFGLEWFIHHPDQTNTSAVWWAGHHSSGCVDYASAPNCN